MVATAIYSVTMALWKETAFPLCRAMERRWERECCLPGVFCDSGDTPALSYYYYYVFCTEQENKESNFTAPNKQMTFYLWSL